MKYFSLKNRIGNLLPGWFTRPFVKYIMPAIRPIERFFYRGINYSKDFYENEYHSDIFKLEERSYDEIINEWEKEGFKRELVDMLNDFSKSIAANGNWLEVGCMHGRTVWWLYELYPDMKYYMFDFSERAIEWINKNNPIPDGTIVWEGDICDITHKDESFNNYFDYITCIDVTEHLPTDVHRQGIREMFRVLKPGGFLFLRQGISVFPEHINVLSESQLVSDFEEAGFVLSEELPNRYHVFTKT